MNDEQIEMLLRKAPRPAAPTGLLGRLQAEIALPRRRDTAPLKRTETAPFLRRWFPAISFAVIFLACVVAIAVQTNELVVLKRENQTLRASAQDLEQVRRANADYQKLPAGRQELAQLRKDFAEVQQLRAEVSQLRAQQQEMDKLRAANQQLVTAGRRLARSQTGDDRSGGAEYTGAKAESMLCINNLKQVGLAARIWATDNGDVYPPDLLSMSNELSTPKILVCPSDKAHTPANNWTEFSPANVSYQFLNPGGSDRNPLVVLSRCPIHDHVVLSDGSVQQGSGLGKSFTITIQDGKKVFTPLNQPGGTSPYE